MQKRKLILSSNQAPGDIVMLTAAVRDLHLSNPNLFLTDVRTCHPDLWIHNPLVTSLHQDEPSLEFIECKYPLINYSNQRPFHFIHGYIQYLSSLLKVDIQPSDFRGDLYLSDSERTDPGMVTKILGKSIPYWILVAGGKRDYTIKWWSSCRFQDVVEHFKNKLQFVQVGLETDHHPKIKGVIDLIGQTSLRDLIHLIHRSEGVVCPVTSIMHLAAAVPNPPGKWGLRPCVVIAGGREPAHWEAYPGHRFLDAIGMLSCCENGGCWKSRTKPLGDGSRHDDPKRLCENLASADLPRCMDLVSSKNVIDSITKYIDAGAVKTLNTDDCNCLKLSGFL